MTIYIAIHTKHFLWQPAVLGTIPTCHWVRNHKFQINVVQLILSFFYFPHFIFLQVTDRCHIQQTQRWGFRSLWHNTVSMVELFPVFQRNVAPSSARIQLSMKNAETWILRNNAVRNPNLSNTSFNKVDKPIESDFQHLSDNIMSLYKHNKTWQYYILYERAWIYLIVHL